ncbi:MAG: transporter substrate-binding domain-containing protein [Hyphomicrobiales bacterium]
MTISPLPYFWHRSEDAEEPDLSKLKSINFLTDSDYPPFNYRDGNGSLVGFNVDLAKALCAALRVRCRIAASKWTDLVPALESKKVDAVIASIAINARNRERIDFTFPYYRSPARFAVQKAFRLSEATPQGLSGRPVGVLAKTAHEAYLKAFFPGADIRPFATMLEAEEALRTGELDAVFGDGTALMFWLNGTLSRQCCRFLPGAFIESRYFGNGAGIAVRKGNDLLREALNYGLDRIKVSGTYDRLYRRHFPLALY